VYVEPADVRALAAGSRDRLQPAQAMTRPQDSATRSGRHAAKRFLLVSPLCSGRARIFAHQRYGTTLRVRPSSAEA
jgi:hypothetical protein